MGNNKVFTRAYQLLKEELVVFALAVIAITAIFLGFYYFCYGLENFFSIFSILWPFVLLVLLIRFLQWYDQPDERNKTQTIIRLERRIADLTKKPSKTSKGKDKKQVSNLELEQLASELAQCTSKYEEALSAQDNLTSQIKTLKEDQGTAQLKIRELEVTVSKQKTELKLANEKLSASEQTIEQNAKTHELSLSDLNAKLESREAKIANLLKEQLMAQARYEELLDEHGQLVSIAAQPKDSQVEDELRNQLAKLSAELDSAKRQVETAREISVQKSRSFDEKARLLISRDEQIKELQSRVITLTADIKTKEEEKVVLLAQLKSKEMRSMQASENGLIADLAKLEADLKATLEREGKLISSVTCLQSEVKKLEGVITHRNERLEEGKQDLKKKADALSKLQNSFNQLQATLAEVQTQLEVEKNSVIDLRWKLRSKTEDLNLERATIKEKDKEILRLNTDLSVVENACQEFERDHNFVSDLKREYLNFDGPKELVRLVNQELVHISSLLPVLAYLQRVASNGDESEDLPEITEEQWNELLSFVKDKKYFDYIVETATKLEQHIVKIGEGLSSHH